jgi:tryptophan synthase alpha subunit
VREVGRWADAAVVGSALVSVIADAGAAKPRQSAEGDGGDLDRRVEEYVRWLKS